MGFQQPSFSFTVVGCTDSTVFNYNLLATSDDSLRVPVIYGCTDSLATNYNINANTDGRSCNTNFSVQIGNYFSGNSSRDEFENSIPFQLTALANILAIGYRNSRIVKVFQFVNNSWVQMGSDIGQLKRILVDL